MRQAEPTRVARTVAVIGAGAAGLATAKRLRDVGIEPIVLERAGRIGGVWNYDDEPRPGSLAYRSLRTNTSRHTMAFGDLAFDASLPDFPARADVLAYLRRYADVQGLNPFIRTHTAAARVRPQGRGWTVIASGSRGDETLEVDAVVVCSGIQDEPRVPRVAGADRFRGEQLHSAAYRAPDRFAGKRVLVVGLGSSGVDIAAETARVARRVVVSAPSGAWLLPRHIAGRPWDHQLTRAAAALPERLRLAAFQGLVRLEYLRRGLDPRRSGLPLPPFDPMRSRFTPDGDLLATSPDVLAFRPALASIADDAVRFVDGSSEHVDVIVWCTGYDLRFPFLDDVLEPDADLGLYGHVFPTTVAGLAFVGICVVAGPLFPTTDLQAAWIAHVYSGERALPLVATMREAIAGRRAARRGRDPLRVDYVRYLDWLAREAGRRINTRPGARALADRYLGPVRAADYR